jgi:hypothetical protein
MKKILDNPVAFLRKDTLRVELDTLDRVPGVSDPHYVLIVEAGSRNLQIRGKRICTGNQ